MTPVPRPLSFSSAPALTPRQASRVFSWTRFLILLALLLSLIGVMTGVLWANRRSGEAVLEAQARESLKQLVRVTADNTRAYLQTAVQIVQINRSVIEAGQLSADDPAGVTLTFNTMLDAIPQLDGVLLGHADGRFVFVRREGTGRYTKVIEQLPRRVTTVTLLDDRNRVVSQTTPEDTYDPRTRPWYKLAMAHRGQMVWTDPYVFSSSQLPGVTVAAELQGIDGTPVVIGADVQLQGLARLLEGIQLTPGGRAFITDGAGHAIATSRAWPLKVQGRVPRLEEVADPALRALLQDGGLPPLDVGAEMTRRYQVGNEEYAAVLRRVEVQPGTNWVVGVYAPEADFTGELRGVAQQQWIIIVTMTLLSILLAWPLAFNATQPLVALQRQATTDHLTGLRNRASFLAQLAEDLERPHQGELGVAILDLDGFKAVNDTFGHGIGDEVLHAVGALLLGALKVGDTLGRLGGDEFALIVHGRTREDVRLRVEGIIQTIALKPIEVAGLTHHLGATAGLSFVENPESLTPRRSLRPAQYSQTLLAQADGALIRGKKREKGRVWLAGEGAGSVLSR